MHIDYPWFIENREIWKIFYGLIITLICLIIVKRSHRIFHISLHQGVRYFRNAFLFYALGFLTRYVLDSWFIYTKLPIEYHASMEILFSFFLIMGGFFLLYSLIWKKFELERETSVSSLFNIKIFAFYGLSFIIAILDFIWQTHQLLFISQIFIFFIASIISCKNYRNKKGKFLKFYFIAMFLSLAAWILNALSGLMFDWHRGVLIEVYLINMIIFLLFLYGVLKFSKIKK